MAETLAKHLFSLSSSDDPAAPVHPRAAQIMSRNGRSGLLSNQFAALLAAVGLREKKAHRKTGEGRGQGRDASGFSFHSLRHTSNSLLKEAGTPDAAIQALIGHDDRDISDHYTHIGRDALNKAAAAFPII